MDEEWTLVKGFENYAVSNYGRICNIDNNHYLKPGTNKNGYLRVYLTKDGKTYQKYVHRLVAEAYLEDYRPGMRVIHYNSDHKDNTAYNLRLRSGKTERSLYEETHKTWGSSVRINETGQVFMSVRHCARFIGGDFSSIYACLRGARNRHLGYTFSYLE